MIRTALNLFIVILFVVGFASINIALWALTLNMLHTTAWYYFGMGLAGLMFVVYSFVLAWAVAD